MTTTLDISEQEAVAGVTVVTADRIGFLADDHNAYDDGRDLPDEVLRAMAGVDLIVHLGHMGMRDVHGRGVLDRLGAVAPVLAVRDVSGAAGQEVLSAADGSRVSGLTRVIEANGIRIGAVHNLSRDPGPAIPAPPGGLPDLTGDVAEVVRQKFGGPVDVVAYAGTHRPASLLAGGILFVNPGSPTYPKGPGRVAGQPSAGTVGHLDVTNGVIAFEVVDVATFRETAETASA